MSIEYVLVFTFFSAQFDISYSILFVQVTLSHFSNFKISLIVGMSSLFLLINFFFVPKKTTKNRIFNSKVASHILCPLFVCKLPHECVDITKNAWRTPLNAQCNIEYRLQCSLFFTFLIYHRNRIFLYFLVNYQKSIISLLFRVSIPNPALSTHNRKCANKMHHIWRSTHN